MRMMHFRWVLTGIVVAVLSGCASYGVIENTAFSGQPKAREYSIRSHEASIVNTDLSFSLSF
jgi:hypothetical protein